MNWFEKYSQEAIVETDAPEQAYEAVVFNGDGVNELIAQRLIAPLDSIDPLVYAFLETVPSHPVSRQLVNLASDGMLPTFKSAVEAYAKDGHAEEVASGTQHGISSLQDWMENFRASGGDRPPFDTLENEIRRFVSV